MTGCRFLTNKGNGGTVRGYNGAKEEGHGGVMGFKNQNSLRH